jgi:hypothetical protein
MVMPQKEIAFYIRFLMELEWKVRWGLKNWFQGLLLPSDIRK